MDKIKRKYKAPQYYTTLAGTRLKLPLRIQELFVNEIKERDAQWRDDVEKAKRDGADLVIRGLILRAKLQRKSVISTKLLENLDLNWIFELTSSIKEDE